MEGTIQQLFEGHHMNYIECINVDFKSTRKESFYGIVIYIITLCLILFLHLHSVVLFYLYNCTLLSYSITPTLLSCSNLMADLQLDVKGCKDVYASFDKYVEVERLEGDNKYHAEGHGLQVGCPHSFILGMVVNRAIWVSSNSFLTFSISHTKNCG